MKNLENPVICLSMNFIILEAEVLKLFSVKQENINCILLYELKA